VGATGSEASGLRLLGFGGRPAAGATIGTVPVTTPTVASTGTTVALAAGSATVTVTARSTLPSVAITSVAITSVAITSVAITSGTAPAIPSVTAITTAAGAVVVPSAVPLSGQARGDEGLVSAGSQYLEEVRGLTCSLGGQHRGHLDAVHELFELHPENVSHRRSGRDEIGLHRAPGLAGTGGPPRPLAVIACAGELDLHPWHGEER